MERERKVKQVYNSHVKQNSIDPRAEEVYMKYHEKVVDANTHMPIKPTGLNVDNVLKD